MSQSCSEIEPRTPCQLAEQREAVQHRLLPPGVAQAAEARPEDAFDAARQVISNRECTGHKLSNEELLVSEEVYIDRFRAKKVATLFSN